MFNQRHADRANAIRAGTLDAQLGIAYHVDAEGRFCATLPVDARTRQPLGLLHGGATAALAESLGSVGSYLLVEPEGRAVVGVEVSANHLKGVRTGTVTATGELIHKGRTLHVWDIRVRNEAGELCAACRLSLLVIDRR